MTLHKTAYDMYFIVIFLFLSTVNTYIITTKMDIGYTWIYFIGQFLHPKGGEGVQWVNGEIVSLKQSKYLNL